MDVRIGGEALAGWWVRFTGLIASLFTMLLLFGAGVLIVSAIQD